MASCDCRVLTTLSQPFRPFPSQGGRERHFRRGGWALFRVRSRWWTEYLFAKNWILTRRKFNLKIILFWNEFVEFRNEFDKFYWPKCDRQNFIRPIELASGWASNWSLTKFLLSAADATDTRSACNFMVGKLILLDDCFGDWLCDWCVVVTRFCTCDVQKENCYVKETWN